MKTQSNRPCSGSQPSVSRREFLQRTGAATTGLALLATPLTGAYAAPSRSSTAETLVQKFHESLSPAQRSQICFPFDHPTRNKINPNWQITKPAIHEDFYTSTQRGMIEEIFKGITSEDGHARFLEQMEFDDGGLDRYHVALFGEPKSGQFEWELTGRHATMRADGDSVNSMAFGGPIVYGHGEEEPHDNLFYYQTQQANEVFKALDAKQAALALVAQAPSETQVQLQGTNGQFPGISVGELSTDQQGLVASVIKDLLAPYRAEDVAEAMDCLEKGGGMKTLHMAFYKQNDLHNDGEWDIWRIEGPSFVSHFRGAPHVHAYLNIGTAKLS